MSTSYKYYAERFATFAGYEGPHQPRELAKCGFIYSGMNDSVRCLECDITVSEWEPDDIPWIVHAIHSPKCRHVVKFSYSSVSPVLAKRLPLESAKELLSRDNVKSCDLEQWANCMKIKGIHIDGDPLVHYNSWKDAAKVDTNALWYCSNPFYESICTRLSSFRERKWRSDSHGVRLAFSGFYCLNPARDRVQCAFCGIVVNEVFDQPNNDNPKLMHRTNSPLCPFLALQSAILE